MTSLRHWTPMGVGVTEAQQTLVEYLGLGQDRMRWSIKAGRDVAVAY